MTDTLSIINGTLHCNQAGILALTSDTLIHKIYSPATTTSTKDILELLKPSIELTIAFIGAFVLVWKYWTQKQKEAAERIIESKRNGYSEFLKDFTETAVKIQHDKNYGDYKDDMQRMLARNQLLLYANDKVVKAYNDWVNFSDKTEGKQIDEEVKLFGKMLVEIRKDIHGNSKLTNSDIENLNPFHRG